MRRTIKLLADVRFDDEHAMSICIPCKKPFAKRPVIRTPLTDSTPLVYFSLKHMIFVESPIFTKLLHELLSDEDYFEFQRYMITNPLAGDVIQGADGLRKIRWSAGNKGKRSGVRVIYYYLDEAEQIRLLLIYKKGTKDDLTTKEKAVLREIKARWQ